MTRAGIGTAIAICFAAALTACSSGERRNVLLADGSSMIAVMDFSQPLALDPLPGCWRHRTFFRTDPMQIRFVTKAGRPSIRLATHNGGSMLYWFTGLDSRTTRHAGYAISQRKRKRVEEIFGWMKAYGGLRRTLARGLARVHVHAYIVGAAYNLLRMSRLQSGTG